jgi:hypothetical protein
MTADVVGSEWSYSLELARALAAHGVRVSLSTSCGTLTKDQRREAARVPGLAVYDAGFQLDWSAGFPEDLGKARSWLLKLEERLSPDIVHLNGFSYGPIVFRSPVVVVAHSASPMIRAGGERSDQIRLNAEIKAALDCADLLIVPTYALLDELKTSFHLNLPSKVIPYFRRGTDYRTSPKQKFVLSAGKSNEGAKARAAVERAASELDWPVVTANATRASTKTAEQFSKAAIYCIPSQSESSDVPVLEGALSRCALVIGDVPNLRENWNNCALFVPPGNTELLRKSLQMLIVDQDLREDMAQRAFTRAREFAPERCIDDYLDAYQGAFSEKHKQEAKII